MSTVVSDVAATETGGGLMSPRTSRCSDAGVSGRGAVVVDGRRLLSARDVAVCVDDTLVGLVTIETLLGADEHLLLEEVMEPDPPRVGPGADQEVAAWKMIHRGESSLAVVDGQDRFVGLIPPTQMLEVLLREHEEDLRRLGGFLHDTAQARLASR